MASICFVISPCLTLSAAALANVSTSYRSDSALPSGSLVSLKQDNSKNVVLATTSNASRLLGVAVPENDSLLAINISAGTVQVAVNGAANTLVSTINGNIKSGDEISISPLNGIGMKAEQGTRIIGIATADFPGSATNTTTQTINDIHGRKTKVTIGKIPVIVAVGFATDSQQTQTGFVGNLHQLANALTGHTVSPVRVVVSFIIAIIALVTLFSLLYGSIRVGLMAMGRNPLAAHSIYGLIMQIMFMSLAVVLAAALIIYFILR